MDSSSQRQAYYKLLERPGQLLPIVGGVQINN